MVRWGVDHQPPRGTREQLVGPLCDDNNNPCNALCRRCMMIGCLFSKGNIRFPSLTAGPCLHITLSVSTGPILVRWRYGHAVGAQVSPLPCDADKCGVHGAGAYPTEDHTYSQCWLLLVGCSIDRGGFHSSEDQGLRSPPHLSVLASLSPLSSPCKMIISTAAWHVVCCWRQCSPERGIRTEVV